MVYSQKSGLCKSPALPLTLRITQLVDAPNVGVTAILPLDIFIQVPSLAKLQFLVAQSAKAQANEIPDVILMVFSTVNRLPCFGKRSPGAQHVSRV